MNYKSLGHSEKGSYVLQKIKHFGTIALFADEVTLNYRYELKGDRNRAYLELRINNVHFRTRELDAADDMPVTDPRFAAYVLREEKKALEKYYQKNYMFRIRVVPVFMEGEKKHEMDEKALEDLLAT